MVLWHLPGHVPGDAASITACHTISHCKLELTRDGRPAWPPSAPCTIDPRAAIGKRPPSELRRATSTVNRLQLSSPAKRAEPVSFGC